MGGRGAGIILDADLGLDGVQGKHKAEWSDHVAEYNPNAGHREIRIDESFQAFADVAKKKYNDEVEVCAVIDDDGYVIKASKGGRGYCVVSSDMEKDIVGKHFTHYHNRVQRTPQEVEQIEADNEKYKLVLSAKSRFEKASRDIIDCEEKMHTKSHRLELLVGASDDDSVQLALKRSDISDADKERIVALAKEKKELEHDWKLAYRRKDSAAKDLTQRANEYSKDVLNENSKPIEVKRFTKPSDVKIPRQKVESADQTGYIGGPFSVQDITSGLFGKTLTFNAGASEGNYQLKVTGKGDIDQAKVDMANLFRGDTKESKAFLKELKHIDRITGEEGRKKKWSMQKRRAASANRQMALLWEKEKEIFDKNGIIATFTPNPDYKPVYPDI